MSFQRPKTKAEHVSDSSVLSSAGRMGCYEKDTTFLGQTGPFFVLLFCLLNAVYISTGLHSLYIVFVGASPSHHCRIADANLSEEWQKASIPSETVNGKLQPSQCWRYRLETVRKLCAQGHSPLEVNLTDITLEKCVDGWSYSTDIYHSTIVSEVSNSTYRTNHALHRSSTAYTSFCFIHKSKNCTQNAIHLASLAKRSTAFKRISKANICLILQTPIFGYIIRSWSKLKAVL